MAITTRYVVLKLHLYLGLAAGLFLLILSVTGTIMAFEHDIDRWLHPKLWSATPTQRAMPEDELVRIAEQNFSPARVVAIQIPARQDLVQILQMSDRSAVYINPWDGGIHARIVGLTQTQRYLGYIHQLHLRLVPDPQSMPAWSAPGKLVVSFAGLILCLLVPTGVILWWRAKRAAIRFGGSWFRTFFDGHQAIGIYASLFLFVAAFTGVMVGFDFAEKMIYRVMHSPEPNRLRPPQASEADGRPRISVEQAMAVGRSSVAGGIVNLVQIPANPKAVFVIQLRTPGEPSVDAPVPATVFVDPYSGTAIQVQNLFAESRGYYMVRLNRAIHTGDFWGTPGHVVVSLTSLLLGIMVITGLVIWWKKLATGG